MREVLELVAERLEATGAPCMLERPGEQPVGQLGVAGKERAVEIRADRCSHPAALEARRAVVAVTGEHRPNAVAPGSSSVRPAWFSKPATVVDTPSPRSTSSSTSPISRRSPATVSSGKRPRTRHPRAVAAPVPAAEQLVAAAHREQGRSRLDRPPEVVAPACEVGRDERLLAVLAAADVDEVERPRLERVTRLDGGHLERVATQGRPAGEHGDVAPVGVDVEVVRVEVRDERSSRRLLPERPHEATAHGDRPQLEHRGVGGEHTELAARAARVPSPRSRASRRSGITSSRAGGKPA